MQQSPADAIKRSGRRLFRYEYCVHPVYVTSRNGGAILASLMALADAPDCRVETMQTDVAIGQLKIEQLQLEDLTAERWRAEYQPDSAKFEVLSHPGLAKQVRVCVCCVLSVIIVVLTHSCTQVDESLSAVERCALFLSADAEKVQTLHAFSSLPALVTANGRSLFQSVPLKRAALQADNECSIALARALQTILDESMLQVCFWRLSVT